ncbi:MAG TPA: peptide chain release factor 3 [Solirubrobacterales bacterium]|nr:peptide chain release factor 3 [Solirubrobacterales bacterium]
MPSPTVATEASADARMLAAEASRRRTFAIISHPDAGKTTLTEKLLLYAGQVTEAGQVKARRNRRAAVSDWMEMERERGISISSTALRFELDGTIHNLLDTPGHRDFSEDTLRVLGAADSCVILLDAARGVEEQTLKLFEVARERRVPLITFINKYDRPGLESLALVDEIERELGLRAAPVTWPVGRAGELRGVIDRRDGGFYRFERTAGGATIGAEQRLDAAEAAVEAGDDWRVAAEEVGLLDEVGAGLDRDSYLAGSSTPVFFGSALQNFGIRMLLDALADLAPAPGPRPGADGRERELDADFSALVFKLQANLDPQHRDRLAYVRVCSGRFERGTQATNARTGKTLRMAYAHELFGRRRETLDAAFPGDVVGLVNAGDVRVGDTLYAGEEVRFTPIPTLAPDRFARLRNRDTGRYKQFHRGVAQLESEGVVHVLHEPELGTQAPVLGGAGQMQFEVARYRLEREFGAAVAIEPAGWTVSRRIDPADAGTVARAPAGQLLADGHGRVLAAFKDRFALERFERAHPEVALDPFIVR